jgi:putrescine importer
MSKMVGESSASPTGPHLRRVLSLRDLFFYGIVAVTPSAPATVFGLADVQSRGHVVVTILAAMAAMVLTAVSYGRLASIYPSAGSAYTYVSNGIHPLLGFVAGWAMLLDYIVIPLFCVLYGTLSLQRALPWMPLWAGAALFAGGITLLNLRGIRSTARTNELLLAMMFIVLGAFIVFAVRYICLRQGIGRALLHPPVLQPRDLQRAQDRCGHFVCRSHLSWIRRCHDAGRGGRKSAQKRPAGLCRCLSLHGSVSAGCWFIWASSPGPTTCRSEYVDTAFIDVTGRVGGLPLLEATAIMLVVANIGAGLTAQVGAARLLFGMGRENVIPEKIFGRLHPVHKTPDVNVILIGALAYLGAQFMSYELTAEILNFGAFSASCA